MKECLSADCRLIVGHVSLPTTGKLVYSAQGIITLKAKAVKSLRLKKHWSQEQLAQLSGLNVRTIQRVEKGDNVGMESLKSLAAVFEISPDELLAAINNENGQQPKGATPSNAEETALQKAKDKAKLIKYFYAFTAYLIAMFLLFILPNYNDGENTGPLVVVFLSFSVMIAGFALYVFQPFGESWENKKAKQLLAEQKERHGDTPSQ